MDKPADKTSRGNERNDATRTRRLALAITMFVCAGGIFGSLFYLQHQARQNNVVAASSQSGRMAPDISSEQKAQTVARAIELRDKWRPWALAHKAELTRMLKAQPNETEAMTVVWNQIPDDPRIAGISPQELVPSGHPSVGIGFGWPQVHQAPNQNNMVGLKPEVKKVLLDGAKRRNEDRLFEFERNRDIILSTSLKGQTHIHLWASGRVTEWTKRPPKDRPEIVRAIHASGRNFFREADLFTEHKEIESPYDFLPQSSDAQKENS